MVKAGHLKVLTKEFLFLGLTSSAARGMIKSAKVLPVRSTNWTWWAPGAGSLPCKLCWTFCDVQLFFSLSRDVTRNSKT
jgi:hypothetical protein